MHILCCSRHSAGIWVQIYRAYREKCIGEDDKAQKVGIYMHRARNMVEPTRLQKLLSGARKMHNIVSGRRQLQEASEICIIIVIRQETAYGRRILN